jgi:shikimate kinase
MNKYKIERRNKNMDNIILIGMSGAGKSTLGVLLAKSLNLLFADTDLLIQHKHQQLLHEILEKEGIQNFKKYEEVVLSGLNMKGTVIATGGSAIYSQLAMERLKTIGLVIYLHVPFERINKRLQDITSRGIVIDEGQSLSDIYLEREPLYNKYADITVNILDETIEETLNHIIEMIRNWKCL